jgi:hypothetical protein
METFIIIILFMIVAMVMRVLRQTQVILERTQMEQKRYKAYLYNALRTINQI